MSRIEQKISQAKAKLLVEYPFFGSIASKLQLSVNDDIQSFKSDGVTLEYNSDFLARLSPSQIEFVLANGAMHASLAHEVRQNGRSGRLWQLATDYAVNDMLVANGLRRPPEAHYSQRFSGMYAEEIYAHLQEDILRDDLEYEIDENDDVQKNENPQSQPKTETILEEQLFEEFAKAKLSEELQSGETLLGIKRFFHIADEAKIDWRRELHAALERFHKDDYALIPPSKKLLYKGVYLPSSISRRFKLVVAVDSSGSVDEKLLGEFFNELNSLMQTIRNYEIDLLVCDDTIRSHRTFYGGDILQADLHGGGGTDFRPVFEFIQREAPDTRLLLYFTDLQGTFPDEGPNFEVKWVVPKEGDVPFGSLLVLE